MIFLVGRAVKPQLFSSMRSSHAHFCTRRGSEELIFRGRGLSTRSRLRRGRPSCALLAFRGGHLSRLGRPLATPAPSPLARPVPSVRVAAGGNQGLVEQPPATPFTKSPRGKATRYRSNGTTLARLRAALGTHQQGGKRAFVGFRPEQGRPRRMKGARGAGTGGRENPELHECRARVGLVRQFRSN